ncbi:hypothetical protein niasHS_000628 [Heterodera schachtii]|uniref:MRG domain-containing protein n=1 Tax=Heterodera schachtii TaxID=97005 RepID=A0ABD2K4T2_HETSC
MPSRNSSAKKKQQNSLVRDESTSSPSTTPKSVSKASNSSSSQQKLQKKKNPSELSTISSGSVEKDLSSSMSTNPHGHPTDKKWAIGEKVLCRYLNSEHIYYEAKVMFLKELSGGDVGYGIHYPGWSNRHDEVVPQHEALIRFKNYSDEEATKAKEDVKRAQQMLNAKKRKQSELKNRSQAHDESSRSSTPGSADNASKRKTARRTTIETSAVAKKDMPQVTLTDPLRRILIDDENLVNKQFMLPKLPARITVFEIVQKYRESVVGVGESGNGGLSPQNLEHSALGLLDYFETAVGTILLYKFERPAFNDLVEELKKQKSEEAENESEAEQRGGAGSELETSKPSTGASLAEKRLCFSKQFGLPHLLRMFVRFTDMLAYTEWSERSLEAIIRHAQDFVMFLSKNHADFYDVEKDYMLAPAEYHKRVWGNHS